MFVRQSTYKEALRMVGVALAQRDTVLHKLNKLVARINAHGGEQLFRDAQRRSAAQFSKDDIQRLLQLVHPDKHDGKPMATEMTKKLLALKESMQ